MATPATTGQLRTQVSDMQIGDYIKIGYNGNFILDTTGLTEYPITGGDWNSTYQGFLYFVKVAKGLLVGDRVSLMNVSWDTLNAGKWIQGKPWDNGNIIPAMSGNNAPSGAASASSSYAGQDPYHAFDGNTSSASNSWVSNGALTGWLEYDFAVSKIVKQYSIYPQPGGYLSRAPKSWTFEAWDGTKWVVLDTQINQTGWADNTKKSYLIKNSTAFTNYRINVSANSGDSGYLSIGELQMMEAAGIMRSLTGGVAYADANGNSSTTDPGNSKYGAWPVNNEFDKYLLGFNPSLIQSGNTINDVFHIAGATWCQETPMNGISANGASSNTQRMKRGDPTITPWFSYMVSSASSAGTGFRPVFDYKE